MQSPEGYAHKYRYYLDGKHGQFLGETAALMARKLTGAVPPAKPSLKLNNVAPPVRDEVTHSLYRGKSSVLGWSLHMTGG